MLYFNAHKIFCIFLVFLLFLGLSACRLKVDNSGTPSLVNFTINGEKGRPFNRFSSNPLVIRVTATAKTPISIFIIATLNGTTNKTLHICDNSPCQYDWLVTAEDNGTYEIKAEVIDRKNNKAIFQYDGDSSNPSNDGEVDVIINIPS